MGATTMARMSVQQLAARLGKSDDTVFRLLREETPGLRRDDGPRLEDDQPRTTYVLVEKEFLAARGIHDEPAGDADLRDLVGVLKDALAFERDRADRLLRLMENR